MNTIQGLYNSKIETARGEAESKLRRLESTARFDDVLSEAINKNDKKPMDKEHRKLWDACIESESLFVNNMLKEMRKSIHKEEWLHGGFAEDIFEDMLYDKYSLEISKSSNLGIAKMLYNELSRKM